jgi:hypothetical protein
LNKLKEARNTIVKTIALGIALLVIFAFVSREAKLVLEVALAIVFTLLLFISMLLELGKLHRPQAVEEEPESPLEGAIAEGDGEAEETEAIVVEAASSQDKANKERA